MISDKKIQITKHTARKSFSQEIVLDSDFILIKILMGVVILCHLIASRIKMLGCTPAAN